jgi:IS30 family transposase
VNAEQIATCTNLHLEGQSIYQIAPQVNRSPSAVAQALRKPDIKAKIEKEANEIINRGLKSARRTLTRLAAIGNAKEIDKDLIGLSLKASQHITNIAGLSGNQPGTIINNLIYNQGAHTQTDAISLAMISKLMDNRVIDNNIIDISEDSQDTLASGKIDTQARIEQGKGKAVP